MWSIVEFENSTLKFTKAQAKKLFKIQKENGSSIWDDESYVLNSDGTLQFNPDHFEHMDYLSDPEIVDAIKKMCIRGRVLFAEHVGRGQHWGHEFDGKGGYRRLVGTVSIHWGPE